MTSSLHWLSVVEGRLFLLLLACLLALLLGGPRSLHRLLGLDRPAAAWRSFLDTLGTRLNKSRRSEATRRFRGLLLTVTTLLISMGLAIAVSGLSRPEGWTRAQRGPWTEQWFFVVEIVLLASVLPIRQIGERLGEVRRLLEAGQLEKARRAVSESARRDSDGLDRHALCRAAVEAMAEDFANRVVATAFWYLLLGLPGAFAVAAVNLLDQMFGHRDRQRRAFGRAPAILGDALLFIPARISCLFVIAAGLFSSGARPLAGLRAMMQQATRIEHTVFLPVACVAGTLGIALGGPRRIGGESQLLPWVGPGSAKLETVDVRRAQLLYAISAMLLVLLVGAVNLLPQTTG